MLVLKLFGDIFAIVLRWLTCDISHKDTAVRVIVRYLRVAWTRQTKEFLTAVLETLLGFVTCDCLWFNNYIWRN